MRKAWWEHERFRTLFLRSLWAGPERTRLCTLNPIRKVTAGGRRGDEREVPCLGAKAGAGLGQLGWAVG